MRTGDALLRRFGEERLMDDEIERELSVMAPAQIAGGSSRS
jgi:hypothetical protein